MPAAHVPDLSDEEDRRYEAHVQRLLDALLEGQRAGNMNLAPSLNPYDIGTPEHSEWERGRHAAVAKHLAADLRERAKKVA